jgi:alpha-N-arabinofuranosidase
MNFLRDLWKQSQYIPIYFQETATFHKLIGLILPKHLSMKLHLLLLGVILIHLHSFGQPAVKLTVDADKPLCEIQPTMWGLFFEDINFAADGGLYAELVKNRSFEFPDPLEGWTVEGATFFSSPVQIVNRIAENGQNPRIARIRVKDSVCMINHGFRGMGLLKDDPYRVSLLSSVVSGELSVRASLIDEEGMELGDTLIQLGGEDWQGYESGLTANRTVARGGLKLCFKGQGVVDIDMVSLFPVHTWKERPNGLRADLVQKLADLEPGFLRFPGGCIVEGRDLSKRYQWKNTVGDIGDRKLLINRWNDENSRATPDYFQTFGLGFFEYFQLAEDLGAEPLPILNCGMACQFNTGELVAIEDMEPYLQDALDLIEFANGPVDSRWGSVRAEMGHPEPFHLKYLGIGNEQWGAQYFERYALFEQLLDKWYPEIKLISGTGPMASGPLFDYNRNALEDFSPALVDEHYYNSPDWFFSNVTRYDDYDRNTHKIFAGEYAAANVRMASPENENVWETALAEAAFMTGLERNADVVYMASYAPLLAHTEAWQWTPDLIWFDNMGSYGTPNYYVQKLFSTNRGTELLPVHRDGEAVTGADGIYASAVWDADTEELIVKLVSNNDSPVPLELKMNTGRKPASGSEKLVLQNTDLTAMNSMEDPEHVVPREEPLDINRKTLKLTLDTYSLTILKIKLK